MEFYLLKFLQNSQKSSNQKFLNTARTWQLQLLFYFVLCCEFLSLPLRTYVYRVCTKYWPKHKSFMVVDSDIINEK